MAVPVPFHCEAILKLLYSFSDIGVSVCCYQGYRADGYGDGKCYCPEKRLVTVHVPDIRSVHAEH